MSVEKNVPEIRFTGFSGEWTEKELNKEVELFSGLTYSPKDVRKEGVFVIRSSNVKNGQLVNADNVYVNPEVVNCSNVKKGDIIVVVRNGSRSLIGKHAQVNSCMAQTVIGAFMTGVRGKQPEFINALFDTNQFTAQVEKNLGATINQITNGAFNSMVFMFPEELEQTSIGNTFQKLDSLINQHQQKHDKLCNIKKAMLEKMFPKQGEIVPEIRFKGFSGEWKSTALAELALFNPREDLPANFKYVDLESVKGTSLIGYRKELKDNAPSRAQRLAKKGDVFFQTVRPYQKNNYLFNKDDDDFVFSTGYAQLRPYYDGEFLLNLVQRDPFVRDVLDNCTGTSYPAINASILAGLRVQYPESKEEQAAIGSYFQKLDTLINQHQQQITKLTNIKQACLSKMFV